MNNFGENEVRFCIKGLMMWERMFNKNFFKAEPDDVMSISYCLFCASNPDAMLKYNSFCNLMNTNTKMAAWIGSSVEKMLGFIEQFPTEIEKGETESGEDNTPSLSLSDMASTLIVDYGVSADYVMNKMELWELESFYKAAEAKVRERYEENRLWAYIQLLPNLTKNAGGPEKILPFPWEKPKEMNKKEANAALNFLKKQHSNGRRTDNSTE